MVTLRGPSSLPATARVSTPPLSLQCPQTPLSQRRMPSVPPRLPNHRNSCRSPRYQTNSTTAYLHPHCLLPACPAGSPPRSRRDTPVVIVKISIAPAVLPLSGRCTHIPDHLKGDWASRDNITVKISERFNPDAEDRREVGILQKEKVDNKGGEYMWARINKAGKSDLFLALHQ